MEVRVQFYGPATLHPGESPWYPLAHSYSAEVKNAWSYTSTPPIRPHGVVLRHRENFVFTLTIMNSWVFPPLFASRLFYMNVYLLISDYCSNILLL